MIDSIYSEIKSLGIRKSKYGVGKIMGECYWVHKSAIQEINSFAIQDLINKKIDLFSLYCEKNNIVFDYNIIKINLKNNKFSMINSPDFDISEEPIVGDVYSSIDGISYKLSKKKSNCFVYHHKWLFVGEGYSGFCYLNSMKRSLLWKSILGNNKLISSKIGLKSYWEHWTKNNNI